MEAQYTPELNYVMVPQKRETLPLFPTRSTIPRPSSAATEIFEDEDEETGCHQMSPMRSVASLGTGSLSTASTPDHVTTPDSTGLTAFDFHIEDREISGPSGPSLFGPRLTTERKSTTEVGMILQDTPVSAQPFHNKASKLDPIRRDTPVPNRATGTTPQLQHVSHLDRASTFARNSAQDWSPGEVVQWMRGLGFDDEIVRKFYYNDISGSILLELQAEDLKELDIMSFGKRHRVMNSIQSLRNSAIASSTATSSSRNSSISNDMPSTQRTSTVASNNNYQSCSVTTDEESTSRKPRRRRQLSDPNTNKRYDIGPGDSVSIVAIEQLLPKMHHCSKGEACRKWQKQQAKLAHIAQGLPIDSWGTRAIVTGDPGNPQTAPNLLKSPTKSEMTPSLVASSDAMGPEKTPSYQLSRERLKEVESQNPQQNVLQFLKLQNQNLGKLQTANNPATPPREFFPSPGTESPDSAKVTPTLAEKIGQLPRLEIPRIYDTNTSDTVSAQRTVTPSVLSKMGRLQSYDLTAVRDGRDSHLRGATTSPDDFYRLDPSYRIETETPFSEVDAPVTAVPIGPVAREESQSVPPNMRFGNNGMAKPEPIVRPASTKAEHHRRYPSTQNVPRLNPLKEGQAMNPIETPDDLRRTPRAAHCRSNNIFSPTGCSQDDATHSGWMRMRKTNKLLFHEWERAYFKLNGTELARHEDDRASKALEHIDVDDYAVACSSLASSSKLTAAFKKTILKRKDNAPQESAFGFSLIPAASNGTTVDRKAVFLNGGKSHHFTVNTRDERIDWMRELMLAKALKRGRDTGAAVNINGSNVI